MKQAITALLLALTLVLGLSGCTDKNGNGNANGGNDNDILGDNTLDDGSNIDDGTARSYNGTTGSYGSSYNGGYSSDGSYSYDNGYGSDGSYSYNNGNNIMDDTEDLLRGRSYEEMLRDGRVNDTDGDLTDGENHSSY